MKWNFQINGNRAAQIGTEMFIVDIDNDWQRGGEPGWLYPPQARICKLIDDQGNQIGFGVVDETGWDGYKAVPYSLAGTAGNYEKASKIAAKIIGRDW